ncbi:MAG TPA: hypothetical protein VG938_09885 [Verrucomicrobiae bacterium]|jgi:hypothetical protein|nr:hypothetical protein [Verrucomicrobiae bacterium]
MKLKINSENVEADKLIPPAQPDASGIGVNYADAYIKVLNVTLENGVKIACKRKGLKIMLVVGDKNGEALMRKREHGPDVKVILRRALEEAASAAGGAFLVENGVVYLDCLEITQ